MPHFQTFNQVNLQSYFNSRPDEIKIGERIQVGPSGLANCRYALVGLPEDIGVRANFGIGGTQTAWPAFLQAFLNIQSTAVFPGDDLCLFGQLDVSDLLYAAPPAIDDLRKAVLEIDTIVERTISALTAAGKIPIVIGGGHNNAYPIIKGAAMGYQQCKEIEAARLNVVNLDAHADFRPMEGRHSGNGFRYAYAEGYLHRYAVIGLHRNYNALSMLTNMECEANIDFTFWEDIFLHKRLTFEQAVERALGFTRDTLCGIELDLDCIENILSSACTPSGISTTQARYYLHQTAGQASTAYLHICEGATTLADGRNDQQTGKLIAYLVSDFLRRHRELH